MAGMPSLSTHTGSKQPFTIRVFEHSRKLTSLIGMLNDMTKMYDNRLIFYACNVSIEQQY